MNKINWNNYFEHIFIVSRCSNFNQRKKLEQKLEKVNIKNYTYMFVPDLDFTGNSKIFKKPDVDTPEHYRCTFAHYMIWKTCNELNYKKVLILEDDIEFIDDIKIIRKMLNIYKKKSEYDIYMFDHKDGFYLKTKQQNNIDKLMFLAYWHGSGYAINTKFGFEYLISQHEKYNLICDTYFYKFYHKLISGEISYELSLDKNTKIQMKLDSINSNLKLEISPIRICYQPDKNYINLFKNDGKDSRYRNI